MADTNGPSHFMDTPSGIGEMEEARTQFDARKCDLHDVALRALHGTILQLHQDGYQCAETH